MNYCHACLRHLNGALACAGCGTPAEYLIPVEPGAADVPPAAAAVPGSSPPAALADVFADSLVVLSGPNEGRSGSRRRAASRKRGRTVLTIGLGLVLATGGSIAVARIVNDDGVDRADKVVLTDDGPKDPGPLPSLDGAPAAPSALPSRKSSGGGKGAAGPSKSASPSASASGSAQPSESASGSASTGPSPSAPGGGSSVQPTASGQPTPGTSGTAKPPAPAPQPTPTQTKPAPKPTEDCVFWIFCG